MPEDLCPPSRSRLLTNPAAEFLETRGAEALGVRSTRTVPGPEFVPELDKFVSYGLLAGKNYFEESEVRKQLFQVTLKKFCEHLEKRKDKDPSLKIKEPNQYTFRDVWEIAEKLSEEHRHVEHVRHGMRSIHKFFRKTGENSSALKRLLAFVPDNTYGSVICGGFTVILGALQRAHDLREDMYSALEKIPKKLQRIGELVQIHHQSTDLLVCADGVLVAIFMTLEIIMSELTKSITRKTIMVTMKGDRYGADIKEALKNLETKVEEFMSQAEICGAQQGGRVEEDVSYTKEDVSYIREDVSCIKEDVSYIKNNFCRQLTKDKAIQREEERVLEEAKAVEDKAHNVTLQDLRQKVKQQRLQLAVYNKCYGFLIANPAIDSRTGKVSVKDLKAIQQNWTLTRASSDTGPSSLDLWLQELQRPDVASTAHCKECLRNSWDLSLKAQDSLMWITGSDELRSWLRASQSTTLVIDSETRPDELMNPMTLSMALVVETLTDKADFPVLSFFCGFRANDAYNEQLSGPLGMLNCLNAQFLMYLRRWNPDIFIPSLGGRRFRQQSQRHVTEALNLLELLVQQLSPTDDAIVIVIESACRLVGPSSKADKAIRGILDIAENAPIIFKVLITDMMSNRAIEGRAVTKLFLPDYIDGERQGLNLDMMQSEATKSAAAFRPHQNSDSSSDGSSSSDDNQSDDESDTSEEDE
ncbi:hypothetical protein VMCG_10294 [Cytospora schulzeri]|uniref:Fungal STAND N-terminal Goodbye domain-containing protein n=1 Tax=Cytospora schulzeri TaxID=448051 RepID=A0A423VAJ3_9PEZI|nr:hypothetical protein VMCG_10294 [Valsa malicola]